MIIMTDLNKINTDILNTKLCINLLNKIKNFIVNNYDDEINFIYYYEYIKFKNYYIEYSYYFNNLDIIFYLNYSGKLHREDGPAWTNYKNGKILNKSYFLNNKMYSYEDYILEIKKLAQGIHI